MKATDHDKFRHNRVMAGSPRRPARLYGWPLSKVLTIAALVAVSGCSVDELDLTGKSCPCPSGWHCDADTETCARGESPSILVDAGAGDAGADAAPDAPMDAPMDAPTDAPPEAPADAGPPLVTVTNLHAGWTTPNWIRWEWESAGVADDLFTFELVTAETEQDVLDRTGTAFVWTADQNPELGHFNLPAVGSEDPVVVSLTDGHQPQQQYFAQLTAIDTAGRRSKSNVAGARTTDPPNHTGVVFSEADVGWSVPPGLELSDRFPYEGTYHYEFVKTCDTGETACYDNPGRGGLEMDPFNISVGALATTAFFEFALATEGPAISYWSQVRLRFGAQGDFYLYPAWTLRSDGQYHVYQIPLRAFLANDQSLPHGVLADGLSQFSIGGMWSDGVYTTIDEVRVRW